jgi:hypothetical protein
MNHSLNGDPIRKGHVENEIALEATDTPHANSFEFGFAHAARCTNQGKLGQFAKVLLADLRKRLAISIPAFSM